MDALDETWETIWKQHRFPEIVCQYLEAWRNRFYLLDETYPFFQVTKQDLANRLPEGKGTTALNAKSFAGKQINRLISESNNKEAILRLLLEIRKVICQRLNLLVGLSRCKVILGQQIRGNSHLMRK